MTALFFFSGSIALVYEIVWTRQMVLLIGASTPAVSTVLGVFMAGLAGGALAFGGLSDRSAAPLRLYGLLEAGIGAYALAMPSLIRWIAPLYIRGAQALGDTSILLGLLRVAVGIALLGLPAALMGGTLPALLKAVAAAPDRIGVDLGRLYTANLLGGVAGTLAAAFVLVGSLGIRGTIAVAALGNLTIALAALLWPRTCPPPAGDLPARDGTRSAAPDGAAGFLTRRYLLGIAFLSGFVTMGYEVVWTRILLFSFLSTVYAFAVILATFLLGLALGSAAFTLAESRHRLGVKALGGVQIAAALFAIGLSPIGARVDGLLELLSERLGFTGATFLVGMAATATLLMLIPATLMGVVFPLASRLLITDAGRSGTAFSRAYWANTSGAVAGAIATGFVVIPLLGLKGGLILLAGVQVLGGWALLLRERDGRPPAFVWALSASGLALAFALLGRSSFDPTVRGAILAHRDDATASVSVSVSPLGGRSLHIDGFEAAAADSRSDYMAMMGHIPMLLHPKPERALVVCFGTGTTAGSVLRYPDVRLDIVDINRTVFDFADFFRDFNHGAARDPRARLVVEDGRGFLQTSRETYDVITSEPMPPTFAGVASLYSREYYELARERLRPGGLVVQWLPFHIVTPAEAWSILRSVEDVFPQTTLWVHEGTGIIVARRDAPVTIDLDRIGPRFESVAGELGRFGVSTLDSFVGMYALGPSGVAALALGAAPVTDDRPSLEYHTPRHRAPRNLATHTEDVLVSLISVYGLGAGQPLPLGGSDPAAMRSIPVRHVAHTHARLGEAYLNAGLLPQAREEYERGLTLSAEPEQRATFLLALAQIARDEGRIPEALRMLDAAHEMAPKNRAVLELRETLTPTAATAP